MALIKELERKIEINRLEGEILIWKQHILIDKLKGDDKELYENAIKDNEKKLENFMV